MLRLSWASIVTIICCVMIMLIFQLYHINHHNLTPNDYYITYETAIFEGMNRNAFKSQGGQDKWLFHHIFHDHTYYQSGFFIEFGARDGIEHSNTYFYEKVLGWHGILAEAFVDELKAIAMTRSKSAILTAAISDATDIQPFIGGVVEGWGGLVDRYDTSRLSSMSAEPSKTIKNVQTFQLRELLQIFAVKHVNYLSIDTEGSELNALKSFPFDTIRVDVISVEVLIGGDISTSRSRAKKEEDIISFMTMKGYKVYHYYKFADDTADIFFTPIHTSWYVGKDTFDKKEFYKGKKICQLLKRCL